MIVPVNIDKAVEEFIKIEGKPESIRLYLEEDNHDSVTLAISLEIVADLQSIFYKALKKRLQELKDNV